MKARDIKKRINTVEAMIKAAAMAGENAWDLLQERKRLWREYRSMNSQTGMERMRRRAKRRPSWA